LFLQNRAYGKSDRVFYIVPYFCFCFLVGKKNKTWRVPKYFGFKMWAWDIFGASPYNTARRDSIVLDGKSNPFRDPR